MISLVYNISNNIQGREHLLNWCYPNVMISEKSFISNKNSKLVKFCKLNDSIKDMVNMFDMVEV